MPATSSTAPLAAGLAALRGGDDIVSDDHAPPAPDKPEIPRRLRGKLKAPQWAVDAALSKYREMLLTNRSTKSCSWRVHQHVQDAWRKYFNAKEAHRLWKQDEKSELSTNQKRALASAAWKAQTPAERAYWLVTMKEVGMPARAAEPVPAVKDSTNFHVSVDHKCLGLGGGQQNYRAHAFLVTYNGGTGDKTLTRRKRCSGGRCPRVT